MATIKFDTLAKPATEGRIKSTFSDIHLDITEETSGVAGFTPDNNMSDIKLDYDILAIKNSLANLFNTVPGQNLMSPDYGLNLLQFVFEKASPTAAKRIGDTIERGITKYEPRIVVEKINIRPDNDTNQYDIELVLAIPSLGDTFTTLRGALTQTGFNF